MTREKAVELLPIIEHFANGGDVQYEDGDDSNLWYDISCPSWCDFITYRIKPDTKSEDLLNRFFGDLKTILDDPKVDSTNLFEHLGKTLKP